MVLLGTSKEISIFIYAFHVTLALFFLLVAVGQIDACYVGPILGILGAGALFYHGQQLYQLIS